MRIDLNANALTDEQQKRFEELCDHTMNISVSIGTAMVVEGILKELTEKFVADCVAAGQSGDIERANILGTIGVEICEMGSAIHNAVHAHASFPEIKALSEVNDVQRQSKEAKTEGDPLSEFLAKRKGTLQ